jgi:hypothetical protein
VGSGHIPRCEYFISVGLLAAVGLSVSVAVACIVSVGQDVAEGCGSIIGSGVLVATGAVGEQPIIGAEINNPANNPKQYFRSINPFYPEWGFSIISYSTRHVVLIILTLIAKTFCLTFPKFI